MNKGGKYFVNVICSDKVEKCNLKFELRRKTEESRVKSLLHREQLEIKWYHFELTIQRIVKNTDYPYPDKSEKAGLKLNIQKTKIMSSSPIFHFMGNRWERIGNRDRFYFLGPENHCGQ